MKISAMLEREDFYLILERTLAEHKDKIGIDDGKIKVGAVSRKDKLFVNTRLNAILAKHPSEAVEDYLKTEYHISGSLPRRLIVKAYLWTSTFFVPPFAQKSIRVNFKNHVVISNVLIYPCNKKIRLFDFNEGVVYTMLKDGFPSLYIDRETAFRLIRTEPFVPRIDQHYKGFYSERIINGKPLARINDKNLVDECKKKALQYILSMTDEADRIRVADYINVIKENCLDQLRQKSSFKESDFVKSIFETILSVNSDEEITLVTSHGDLQPGNIWIRDDGQIVIIDWETVKKRSRYYDYVALYFGLRKKNSYQRVIGQIMCSNEIQRMVDTCSLETITKVVLAEELAYQTEELISFPDNIGVKEYLQVLNEYKTIVL
jgi:hypothetical protein